MSKGGRDGWMDGWKDTRMAGGIDEWRDWGRERCGAGAGEGEREVEGRQGEREGESANTAYTKVMSV